MYLVTNRSVHTSAKGLDKLAKKVLEQAKNQDRNILFFIHGYNNDLDDILNRAAGLERAYGVIPLVFTWPANGGGTGVVCYRSDKRDARASAGALERTIEKAHEYLLRFNAGEVDKIKFRNCLYIVINENDVALRASRVKTGEEQLARLGHVTRNLASGNAVYVDFTQADKVKTAHACFEGTPATDPNIRTFFNSAFNGKVAEDGLTYVPELGLYRVV